jgi:hypothetical protein
MEFSPHVCVEKMQGVPVSGRSWKLEAKRKSSMIVSNKLIRTDVSPYPPGHGWKLAHHTVSLTKLGVNEQWKQKMANKAVHKAVKDKEKALIQVGFTTWLTWLFHMST